MTGSLESLEIAVCGMRPEGSVAHLAAFAFAIWLAFRFSPRRREAKGPGGR